MKYFMISRALAILSIAAILLGILIVSAISSNIQHGPDFSGMGEAMVASAIAGIACIISSISWIVAIILHWIGLWRHRNEIIGKIIFINSVLIGVVPFVAAMILLIRVVNHGL